MKFFEIKGRICGPFYCVNKKGWSHDVSSYSGFYFFEFKYFTVRNRKLFSGSVKQEEELSC